MSVYFLANTPNTQKIFGSFLEMKEFFEGVSEKALNEALEKGIPLRKGKDEWCIDILL